MGDIISPTFLIFVTLLISISSILGYVIVGRHKPYSCYVNPNGKPVKLLHNKNAIHPTFEQLMEFLAIDQTEKLQYIPGQFVCSNFAETLQHNAMKAGYKCGWVAINFKDGSPSHSCNAFNTVDKGVIFIDCSGGYDTIVELSPHNTYISRTINSDVRHIPMGEVLRYRIFW